MFITSYNAEVPGKFRCGAWGHSTGYEASEPVSMLLRSSAGRGGAGRVARNPDAWFAFLL